MDEQLSQESPSIALENIAKSLYHTWPLAISDGHKSIEKKTKRKTMTKPYSAKASSISKVGTKNSVPILGMLKSKMLS